MEFFNDDDNEDTGNITDDDEDKNINLNQNINEYLAIGQTQVEEVEIINENDEIQKNNKDHDESALPMDQNINSKLAIRPQQVNDEDNDNEQISSNEQVNDVVQSGIEKQNNPVHSASISSDISNEKKKEASINENEHHQNIETKEDDKYIVNIDFVNNEKIKTLEKVLTFKKNSIFVSQNEDHFENKKVTFTIRVEMEDEILCLFESMKQDKLDNSIEEKKIEEILSKCEDQKLLKFCQKYSSPIILDIKFKSGDSDEVVKYKIMKNSKFGSFVLVKSHTASMDIEFKSDCDDLIAMLNQNMVGEINKIENIKKIREEMNWNDLNNFLSNK